MKIQRILRKVLTTHFQTIFNKIYGFRSAAFLKTSSAIQRQPTIGVLRKRCSKNMLQNYRRTPMPKCDFNKVAKQLYWNHTSAWVFSCKFAAYFQNTFSQEHLWRAAFGHRHLLRNFQNSYFLKTVTLFLWLSSLETCNTKVFKAEETLMGR